MKKSINSPFSGIETKLVRIGTSEAMQLEFYALAVTVVEC